MASSDVVSVSKATTPASPGLGDPGVETVEIAHGLVLRAGRTGSPWPLGGLAPPRVGGHVPAGRLASRRRARRCRALRLPPLARLARRARPTRRDVPARRPGTPGCRLRRARRAWHRRRWSRRRARRLRATRRVVTALNSIALRNAISRFGIGVVHADARRAAVSAARACPAARAGARAAPARRSRSASRGAWAG